MYIVPPTVMIRTRSESHYIQELLICSSELIAMLEGKSVLGCKVTGDHRTDRH
jgi:hypothetical protein